MKKLLIALLCLFAIAQVSFAAEDPSSGEPSAAAETVGFPKAREKLKKMSPEERKEFMAKSRKQWEGLSAKEKKDFEIKVKAQKAQVLKTIEERCKRMRENNGARVTFRLYALDQLEAGK